MLMEWPIVSKDERIILCDWGCNHEVKADT